MAIRYLPALLAVLIWPSGCTLSRVIPPREVEDPVRVYLADSGDSHFGLLLPTPGGEFVEYAYGEWRWYALGETATLRVFPTLFWPTQGTLGKKVHARHDLEGLREELKGFNFFALDVERDLSERLRHDLDARHARGTHPLYHEVHRLHFVEDPSSYHVFHTCFDEVARWLRRLDCKVSPAFVRLGFGREVIPREQNPGIGVVGNSPRP